MNVLKDTHRNNLPQMKTSSISIIKYIVVALLFALTFYIGRANGDPNNRITYGDTGFPKNCRAIIDANIKDWQSGIYSAEEAFDSIERNCGATGYSWGR